MYAQMEMDSPIGKLYLVASEKGLQGVYWQKQAWHNEIDEDQTCLRDAAQQIAQYLEGTRRSFDLPLDMTGTDFQRSVWQELMSIPFGQTCSYQYLATKIGKPKAIRAVGTANACNPLCLVVPCHRVIAADGSLGGYSGGLETKSFLLQLERAEQPVL